MSPKQPSEKGTCASSSRRYHTIFRWGLIGSGGLTALLAVVTGMSFALASYESVLLHVPPIISIFSAGAFSLLCLLQAVVTLSNYSTVDAFWFRFVRFLAGAVAGTAAPFTILGAYFFGLKYPNWDLFLGLGFGGIAITGSLLLLAYLLRFVLYNASKSTASESVA